MIDNHPEWQKMHNLILRECDVLLKGPDLERKMQGVSMLKVSREMWKHAFYLSYAYRMTGDKRYARKVERDMLTVCRFFNWNPEHCLDEHVRPLTPGVYVVVIGKQPYKILIRDR